MEQQVIIGAVLLVCFFGALAFVLFAPTKKDKANKRISAVGGGRTGRTNSTANVLGEAATKERRRKVSETLAQLDGKQKNAKKKKLSLEQTLEQTGFDIKESHFYTASFICALVLGGIGLATGQKLWVCGLMLVVGGLGLPKWVVNFLRKRRQKKFSNEFSNAIDVIVRGVKSGLPVNDCLRIISKEAPRPVSDEFHMLVEGMRVGMSMEHALERMYERMPLQEVNFFGIVLVIQQKTGGNLAEALGNLANVLRSRKLMQGKIKALSAEAKASAYIIGSLPFLVMGAVQFASPEYLLPLFTTAKGNFILIVAGLWMCTGIFVMSKMVQIKV